MCCRVLQPALVLVSRPCDPHGLSQKTTMLKDRIRILMMVTYQSEMAVFRSLL